MTFQEKMALIVSRHKLSYDELADAIGVHRGKPSRWIAEGVTPKLDDAFKIARRFGVSLEWLADDARECEPETSKWRELLNEEVDKMGEEKAYKTLIRYGDGLIAGPESRGRTESVADFLDGADGKNSSRKRK